MNVALQRLCLREPDGLQSSREVLHLLPMFLEFPVPGHDRLVKRRERPPLHRQTIDRSGVVAGPLPWVTRRAESTACRPDLRIVMLLHRRLRTQGAEGHT